MRPLASPVAEFRLMASVLLIGGAALSAAAIAVQGAGAAVVTVVVASLFGGWMYVSVCRPLVRGGVRDLVSVPTDDREPGWATTPRILVLAGFVLGVCLLVVVAFGKADSVAGIVVGGGAAMLWTSR